MDEIINFSDFLKGDSKGKSNVSLGHDSEKKIRNEEINIPKESIEDQENIVIPEDSLNEGIEIEENSIELPIEEESNRYKVYKDKNEIFTCEMQVEGVVMSNTKVRLILENKDWNLVFNGEVDSNGKVSIPIKKLNILEEGCTGSIKMEVIAEDTVFVPWEQEFEVKMSKKVMVKFNEKSTPKPLVQKKPTIKVNVK